MVTTCMHTLSTGVELECRTSGKPGQPLLLFLHGFPEGAFIWDGLLEQFGGHYRCVAPNLRGYGRSSQPTAISDYRAKYLVEDLAALIALEKEGETGIEEGCLSIPEQRALVPRAEKVKIRALDREGKPYELEADGLLAICIQHEMDHLVGKLFIDYLSPLKQQRIRQKVEKLDRLNARA